MDGNRLRKLRERAFEAGILGSSKMDERELLAALARAGCGPSRRSLLGLRVLRSASRGA